MWHVNENIKTDVTDAPIGLVYPSVKMTWYKDCIYVEKELFWNIQETINLQT